MRETFCAGSEPVAVLCCVTAHKRICSRTLPSTEARLTGLQCPTSFQPYTGQPPVIWDPPSYPGLIINDGEQLSKLFLITPG